MRKTSRHKEPPIAELRDMLDPSGALLSDGAVRRAYRQAQEFRARCIAIGIDPKRVAELVADASNAASTKH